MKKSKEQVSDLEAIETYFTTGNEHMDEHYFEIYKEAEQEGIFESLLTPLSLISKIISDCYDGRKRPIQTVEHVKRVIEDQGLNHEQKCFVYHHLIRFIDDKVWEDENNKKVNLQKIKELLDNVFSTLTPETSQKVENFFDWEKTKKHLETLPDTKSKIKYLMEIGTEYKQSDNDLVFFGLGKSFDQQCELEIKKLKELAALESTPPQKAAKPQLGQFNNSQIVLIFYYFFKLNGLEPRTSIDISPIAKFIHLITGKEFTSVTNSDFYNKLRTVPNFKSDKELINDLEAIKPLFKKVQLNEAVKMIDNEIDLARNELKRQRK